MKTIAQLSDLSGRKALVTGGGGHIGAAAAETLLELGAETVLLDVNKDVCDRRAAALDRTFPGRVRALSGDLGDEESAGEAVHETVRLLGGLDILIHSAAFVGTTDEPGWAVPFEEQTVAAWDKAMRVNLTSAFVLAREARDYLSASGYGSIVFFSSIYGIVGPDMSLYEGTNMANPAGYNASKGGLLQLTRYLATVLAPRIRVNAISPGGVLRGQPDAFRQRYEARTPLGRMAREEDLKGAVAYLAGDLSAYITGHNLVVDGGWSAW